MAYINIANNEVGEQITVEQLIEKRIVMRLSRHDHSYISIVSIIFDCFIPIFYNFHILLPTFYIIFGTTLLQDAANTTLRSETL